MKIGLNSSKFQYFSPGTTLKELLLTRIHSLLSPKLHSHICGCHCYHLEFLKDKSWGNLLDTWKLKDPLKIDHSLVGPMDTLYKVSNFLPLFSTPAMTTLESRIYCKDIKSESYFPQRNPIYSFGQNYIIRVCSRINNSLGKIRARDPRRVDKSMLIEVRCYYSALILGLWFLRENCISCVLGQGICIVNSQMLNFYSDFPSFEQVSIYLLKCGLQKWDEIWASQFCDASETL